MELYNDIVNSSSYNKYCKSEDFYTVFYNIVLSMILGREIILLDDDFSKEEILNLTGVNDISKCVEEINNIKEKTGNYESFIKKINNPSKDWKITLFTSGTTGHPKKVSHSFKTIARYVKVSDKHKFSIWGFAYNPTHMAGLQVLFQALINENSMVRLFRLDKEEILNEIQTNKITHISATPTFYRLLLPTKTTCKSVYSITSGGEKFDNKSKYMLKYVFPNAVFKNVYASTEAGSLFASDGDVFKIKNKFVEQITVRDNELYIHKSLLGIADDIKLVENTWYATGDIVKILNENPLQFRFANRKNEMINVGGYKVNPLEVEDELRKIEDVLEVRVFAKANSILGNIVVAEIVSNNKQLTENEIRMKLQANLQEYKIPRIFKFVENIEVTRTGKISRK